MSKRGQGVREGKVRKREEFQNLHPPGTGGSGGLRGIEVTIEKKPQGGGENCGACVRTGRKKKGNS